MEHTSSLYTGVHISHKRQERRAIIIIEMILYKKKLNIIYHIYVQKHNIDEGEVKRNDDDENAPKTK